MPWWWWPLAAAVLAAVTHGPLSEWMLRRLIRTRNLTPAERDDAVSVFSGGLLNRWWFRWFARPLPDDEETK